MRTSRRRILIITFSVIAVMAVIAAAHWPALSAEAICFDDEQYLVENSLVKNPSWNSVKQFLSEILEPSTVGGYYQPLSMISLMLDYARGGRVDDLTIFHQSSLLLHLFNTALIVYLIYSLFGKIWLAATAGLLFGIHPMTVETIAWVSERKTLLAACFSLLALNFFVRYTKARDKKFYFLTVLMYLLALLSKPTSTPLPLLMLVLDYWPLRRLSKAAVNEKIPMLAIGVISGVITIVSQARTGGVTLLSEQPLLIAPLIAYNFIFYIFKIFYPVHLSPHYPFPARLNLGEPVILVAVAGFIVLSISTAISLRKSRAIFAGLLFFMIGILPTMQIIGFSNVIASDKFAYLPSIGLLVSGAYLCGLLWDYAGKIRFMLPVRTGIAILLMFTAISEILLTRNYLVQWRDTTSLYSHMLKHAPDSPILHNNFGVFYYKAGRIDAAIEHWSKAVEIAPDYPDAINNLAWVLATDTNAEKRDGSRSVQLAQRACELTGYRDPAKLDTLAAAYAEVKEFDTAIVNIQQAIQIAGKSGRKELAAEMSTRLELYQNGQNFRQ